MRQTGVGTSASIVLATAMVLASAAAAHAQTGPVGYWKGDDGASPTQALDSATGMNDGTYAGGATTNSSSKPALLFPNASSMSFNGTSAYVNIPSFTWPSGGGPITVAFWNFTAGGKNSSAFTVGNMDAPNRCQAHAPWGDNVLYWDYGDYTNGRISTNYAGYLNAWTHVALVSQGNGGAFKAIYLNGTLANSSTTCLGPSSALTGVQIGAWTGPSLYHNGLIDDFRVYNRMLTATEIAALAAGNTEPGVPTGLGATGSVNQNPGQVDLVWTAVSGATSYNLKWGTTLGGPYPNVIPVAGTTYSHTGLTVNVTYYYVVTALNSLGESANSLEASARPTPPPRTTTVGPSHNQCGCGVSSEPSPWLLGGLATLGVLVSCRRRQRTLQKATLR